MIKNVFSPISMAALLLLHAFLGGCGYHVAGTGGAGRGALEGIESLSVPVFENATRRPGVEAVITDAIVGELINVVRLKERAGAGAVLEGVVTGYRLDPVSYTTGDVASEYRLTVTLSLRLVRAGDGALLWSDRRMTDYEDFAVDPASVAATRDAERAALERIAADAARLLRERILTDF